MVYTTNVESQTVKLVDKETINEGIHYHEKRFIVSDNVLEEPPGVTWFLS